MYPEALCTHQEQATMDAARCSSACDKACMALLLVEGAYAKRRYVGGGGFCLRGSQTPLKS